MRRIYSVIDIVSAAFAFAAAWFWLRSSQMLTPDLNLESLMSIKPWLYNISYYNLTAALCAVVAGITEAAKILLIRAGFF